MAYKKTNQVPQIRKDVTPQKRIFRQKTNQVHPIQNDITPKQPFFQLKRNKVPPIQVDVTPEKSCPATPHQEVTMEIKTSEEKKGKKTDEGKKIIQAMKTHIEEAPSAMITKFLRHDHFQCLGLPNPAQNCYMNSCLQSLLTLEDFVNTISCQEQLFLSFFRSFLRVKKAYTSPDLRQKIPLLSAFKGAVSVHAPEFKDFNQKDAHEFLTSIFQQIIDLAPLLHMMAASMDKTYTCPVERQMMFKMENTRICRRCAAGSNRQEVFTNLSLDLIPGCGTVDELLMSYLKETDLEYRCEGGSILSGQRSSFATLPRVLVLHMKRFRYTSFYTLKKACQPIHLNKDLVVSTKQDTTPVTGWTQM
ncbi:ubiquitin carboxyl-terminal hydrolase 37-like [Labrus bergylta]|uniref:ubiquitin carboxyl-terminal hydrolase 37-like n=1 Tax=Labrus bergylta TaxID=56723 RepID=UPI003313A6C0